MAHYHGLGEQRGMNEAATTASGRVRSHRFSNRFAALEPYAPGDGFLESLGGVHLDGGDVDGPMLGDPTSEAAADADAGVAFFGQFIDHEITFDPTSELEQRNDPRGLRNFRTPALDLDSVYGGGSEVRPFLFDDRDGAKLLTAPAAPEPTDEDAPRPTRFGATDLQRNRQGSALLTDPRNDENLVVSQLHLTFAKFHNRVVDYVRSGDGHALLGEDESVYDAAKRLVRWHYQWLVLHEFLPSICDGAVFDDIENSGRSYFLRSDDPVSIPVEFAGAAYRYGHSQIRDRYTVNDDATDVQFFPGPAPENAEAVAAAVAGDGGPPPRVVEEETSRNLNGFAPVPDELVVDWPHFFDHDPAAEGSTAQPARPIDTAMPPALMLLPFISHGPTSLAARNLHRGKALGLPSGQAVAERMGIEPLDNDDIPLPSGQTYAEYLRSVYRGAETEAPLWLYVLGEAAVQEDGHRLGAVGSRIVAEVIHGMVDADDRAFVNEAPEWTPTLPRPVSDGVDDRYRFADLFQFATGPAPDGLALAAIDGDGSGDAPGTPESDRTNGEAVVLEHTGAGPLSLGGYQVDYEEQTETVDALDEPIAPGETVVVYTGSGPASTDDIDARVITFDRDAAVIEDGGESVVVRTPTGEVSAFGEYGG
ncbi:peroxidase [Halolamina sp. CBA1230]|uniref:peroxidase family protein n=1 Tax=Halolamina sp. CBA1230 TaxID=1853690 RepID=UPI0009A1C3E5|nr:peroxidase family protein [Halolamina sp. CBA1230]QKY19278.1 peroxidase [Halolamina sp. CBA1230]